MTHPVDAIATAALGFLTGTTDAGTRVTRDLPQTQSFQAENDLPAIDVRVGEEDSAVAMIGFYRATVRLLVDLYVADAQDIVSSTLLDLRAQAHRAVMAPGNAWPTGFLRVLPGPAGAVTRNTEGAVNVAAQRLEFLFLYQHSLSDPEQP